MYPKFCSGLKVYWIIFALSFVPNMALYLFSIVVIDSQKNSILPTLIFMFKLCSMIIVTIYLLYVHLQFYITKRDILYLIKCISTFILASLMISLFPVLSTTFCFPLIVEMFNSANNNINKNNNKNNFYKLSVYYPISDDIFFLMLENSYCIDQILNTLYNFDSNNNNNNNNSGYVGIINFQYYVKYLMHCQLVRYFHINKISKIKLMNVIKDNTISNNNNSNINIKSNSLFVTLAIATSIEKCKHTDCNMIEQLYQDAENTTTTTTTTPQMDINYINILKHYNKLYKYLNLTGELIFVYIIISIINNGIMILSTFSNNILLIIIFTLELIGVIVSLFILEKNLIYLKLLLKHIDPLILYVILTSTARDRNIFNCIVKINKNLHKRGIKDKIPFTRKDWKWRTYTNCNLQWFKKVFYSTDSETLMGYLKENYFWLTIGNDMIRQLIFKDILDDMDGGIGNGFINDDIINLIIQFCVPSKELIMWAINSCL